MPVRQSLGNNRNGLTLAPVLAGMVPSKLVPAATPAEPPGQPAENDGRLGTVPNTRGQYLISLSLWVAASEKFAEGAPRKKAPTGTFFLDR